MTDLVALFRDGGPWMWPVAVTGALGLGLALVNAITRRRLTPWAAVALGLCLLLGLLGAARAMSTVLQLIAAGPAGHKLWMPLHRAAAGLLPAAQGALLAAGGSVLLGLSCAVRTRARPARALGHLLDGLVLGLVLLCLAALAHLVPDMLIAASGAREPYVAMARGLAASVHRLQWPAGIGLSLLLLRCWLSARYPHATQCRP